LKELKLKNNLIVKFMMYMLNNLYLLIKMKKNIKLDGKMEIMLAAVGQKGI
jgi:hypothetical protein